MAGPPIQGRLAPDEDQGISPPTPKRAKTHAGLFRAAPAIFLVLWSTGFTVAKVGLAHAGPLTFLALRYALVVAALLPALLIVRPPLPHGPRAWRDLATVGLLVQFGYFALNWGALAVGAGVGVAALAASLQPVLTALLAPLAGGPRMPGRAWLGLALGLAGAALVIAARSGIAAPTAAGVLLALGSVTCMAAGTLWEKRAAGMPGGAAHPLTAASVQYSVGFLASLAAAALLETMRVDWTADFAWSLLYLVVANSLVAISLLLAMVRRGDAARVSTLFFLVPPAAALAAWLITGERLPLLAWPGMVLAALGVLLATRRS